MLPWIPGECVGLLGARNAKYLSAQIIGLSSGDIRYAYDEYRQSLRDKS